MLEQFQLSLIILVSTIVLVIALIYIIKIIISNKTIAYYVFKECYGNTDGDEKSREIIKKQSFFYFDKIENDNKKSI